MKGFGKLTLVLILALALATAVLLTLAVEENPLITARAELTPEQIGRAKMIFKNNDPRRLRSGSIAKVSLEQQELDLAINYFANQYLNGAARLQLDSGRALIQSSLSLPTNPLGRFLNVQLEFAQASPLPHVDRLTLGKLRLPGLLADPLVNLAVASLQSQADRTTLANIVKHVQIQPGQLTVVYRWQADLPAKLRNALFDSQYQTRIEAYQRRLVSLSQPLTNGVSLTALSRPLFQLAAERSQSNDPIAENRALILVLSFYANRLPLYKIVPQATSWPRPIWRTWRRDSRRRCGKTNR